MNKLCKSIMFKKMLALTVLLLTAGCDEEKYNNPIDGKYSGLFTIYESFGESKSGNVTVTFYKGTYKSEPEKLFLPPYGAGIFEQNGNSLTLRDTLLHTADFDWTLILNGQFETSSDGKKLYLRQIDIKHQRVRVFSLERQ